MIDEQGVVENTIIQKAKELAGTQKKSVIIVKGGPGTGKSVIALDAMAEIMKMGIEVYHATGSSAFTKNVRDIVGPTASPFFKFFYNFTKTSDDQIPVLICDEAHRIRKNSSDWGVPLQFKSKVPQINDLIRPARLSIFFLDERQVVRPNEIGSIELIKTAAKNLGVANEEIFEFELTTQFRCGGSVSYLQWLENVLGMNESDKTYLTKEDRIQFTIVDNPVELKRLMDEKNNELKNSARIVAGFCWPWSEPRPDGTLVDDVVIGTFRMPWEKKDEFWRWARHDSGMEQVGTVYTAQGFEFDYIFVIFSDDLTYNSKTLSWEAHPEKSYDAMAKRGNDRFDEHLKNIYRVLLSRAHKGVYVYFTDKETESFFKSRISN